MVFTPSGLRARVPIGTSVLDAARHLGVDLDSVCGGRGICGRCQVTAPSGTFDKWAITSAAVSLSPPGAAELDYRGRRPLAPDHRLGCQAAIRGDVVIDVPALSQLNRQIVRKDVRLTGLELDPSIRLHYVETTRPELGDHSTAVAAISAALADQWGLPGVRVQPRLLDRVHAAIAAPHRGLTVAVSALERPDGEIVAIWPGFTDSIIGVAFDVGSTTIAGHLIELLTGEGLASAGQMNPQIRFGEDLMSRVSYAMMNPGGAAELTTAVRRALAELISELTATAERTADEILLISLVGNPVMHHLVLGIDPAPLGVAPFVLATSDPVTLPATDLDLPAPNATAYLGPCIAGHVGADCAAAILAEGPHRQTAGQLLVDIGTNAEIVLGNRDGLFAASSPTGPAFEGAQLSCGVRATVGAIERVRIDPQSLEPRFKVIGQDHWSDDPAFDPRRPIVGVCGSGIIEALGEMVDTGIMDAEGVIGGHNAARTPRVVPERRTFAYVLHAPDGGPELRITQNDVRAIQLAKAALRAGIDLLMEHAGTAAVDDIRLAGAFGAHIDPGYAVKIGLVPDGPRGAAAVSAAGNAAGNGAVRMLLSAADRREIAELVTSGITKIETATEPRFQELFVDAMAFPHRSAAPRPAGQGRRRRRREAVTGSSIPLTDQETA